jgi:hypothetical protein
MTERIKQQAAQEKSINIEEACVNSNPGNVHGIKVREIRYDKPGNNLPKWVKQQTAERGYGDALQHISLFVTEDDIKSAFECAAQGNGDSCVMAQAGKRLGAKQVYFYRTTVWIDFGNGPIVRYLTSRGIYKNVIDPFDRGDREAVSGGLYPLLPPRESQSLNKRRQHNKNRTKKNPATPRAKKNVVMHTDRIVLATQASIGDN